MIEPDRQPNLMTINPVERIPASSREWTRLMTELGIRPNKGLGQHFLFERGLVERMVRQAGVSRDDTVLEVGPGLGILTSELLRKAGGVVAVELDRSLAAHLRQAFGDVPGFTLVEGNALTTPIDKLIPEDEPYDVVANLPYSVGSAILRHLLEQPRKPRRMTVMLQKEVAERLVAAAARHEHPGGGDPVLRRAADRVHRLPDGVHPAAEGGVGGGDPRGAGRDFTAGRDGAALLQDRHLRLPSEAEAGRQLDCRRAPAAKGADRGLAGGDERRSDAAGGDPHRRGVGGAGDVGAAGGRGGVSAGERRVAIDAPAKLNLGLEVLGRRDDGYHELATIFLAVDLYDQLILSDLSENPRSRSVSDSDLTGGEKGA